MKRINHRNLSESMRHLMEDNKKSYNQSKDIDDELKRQRRQSMKKDLEQKIVQLSLNIEQLQHYQP